MNSINYARIILKSLVRSYRQFYVPIPIMWRGLSTHATRIIKNDLAAEYMFRTFMVLVTCTLSRLEEYYTEDKFFAPPLLLILLLVQSHAFLLCILFFYFSAFGCSHSQNWLSGLSCWSSYWHIFGNFHGENLLKTMLTCKKKIYISQALILPPILEYVTLAPNISKGMLTKDILILIFGIIGFITGTYSTILAIVKEFSG